MFLQKFLIKLLTKLSTPKNKSLIYLNNHLTSLKVLRAVVGIKNLFPLLRPKSAKNKSTELTQTKDQNNLVLNEDTYSVEDYYVKPSFEEINAFIYEQSKKDPYSFLPRFMEPTPPPLTGKEGVFKTISDVPKTTRQDLSEFFFGPRIRKDGSSITGSDLLLGGRSHHKDGSPVTGTEWAYAPTTEYSHYGYPNFQPETLSECFFGPGYDISGQPVSGLRGLIDDTPDERRYLAEFIEIQERLERRRIGELEHPYIPPEKTYLEIAREGYYVVKPPVQAFLGNIGDFFSSIYFSVSPYIPRGTDYMLYGFFGVCIGLLGYMYVLMFHDPVVYTPGGKNVREVYFFHEYFLCGCGIFASLVCFAANNTT